MSPLRRFIEKQKSLKRKAFYKKEMLLYFWHLYFNKSSARWPVLYDPYNWHGAAHVPDRSPSQDVLRELGIVGPTKARLKNVLEMELRKRAGW